MKTYSALFVAALFLITACRKEAAPLPEPEVLKQPCQLQTTNPLGRSYSTDSIVDYTCTSNLCGILPLSTRNYWVYLDSVFSDGQLLKVQYDTLRFTRTYKSISDGLVWWESNMNIGLPEKLYASDSAIFKMESRMFLKEMTDVKKEYGLFTGDSLRYLSGFQDAAAITRSIKMPAPVKVQAGTFTGSLYIEKNARNFRKDQVIFQPGVGVLRYVQEKAPMGSPAIKLQQISTLVSFHFE